jgi:TRAP-type C4-dicarboxylate transport system substrate-binding protein
MTNKIRWTIAHEPAELFYRTAAAFNQHLSALTGGEYEVETVTSIGAASYRNLIKSLEDGSIDMVQIPVGRVGLDLLNWPYLFQDHAHATRVLEGDIGKSLLKRVRKIGYEGLGFTYSGGFRIFVSDNPINSLADLKSTEIAVHDEKMIVESLSALGLKIDPKPIDEDGYWTEDFESTAAESTFTRYLSQFPEKKNIINTEHSLFLTTVIARGKWFDSLDPALQAAIRQAVELAAADERSWSNEDTVKIRSRADELGITIYDLSPFETAELKSRAESFTVSDPFYNKIIKTIQAA